MKKLFTIIAFTLLVSGCAKKTSPANSNGFSPTNGSAISGNNEKPGSNLNNTVSGSENTNTVFTTSETSQTKTVVKAGTSSPEVLSQIAGQSTYNAKCNRCHQYKVTTDYTADRWASIIAVMANATHANLTDIERFNVLAYVRANSKK